MDCISIIVSSITSLIAITLALIAVYQVRKTTQAQRDMKVFDSKKSTYCELMEAFAMASVKINNDFDYDHLVCVCYKAMLFLPETYQHDFDDLFNDAAQYRNAMKRGDDAATLAYHQKMQKPIKSILEACKDSLRNNA